MNRHKKSTHEGIRYSCPYCDYHAVQSFNLKMHITTIHDGLRSFKCKMCEATFTRQISLAKHKRGKHEGVSFSCSQCEYTALQQGNLKNHIKNVH